MCVAPCCCDPLSSYSIGSRRPEVVGGKGTPGAENANSNKNGTEDPLNGKEETADEGRGRRRSRKKGRHCMTVERGGWSLPRSLAGREWGGCMQGPLLFLFCLSFSPLSSALRLSLHVPLVVRVPFGVRVRMMAARSFRLAGGLVSRQAVERSARSLCAAPFLSAFPLSDGASSSSDLCCRSLLFLSFPRHFLLAYLPVASFSVLAVRIPSSALFVRTI